MNGEKLENNGSLDITEQQFIKMGSKERDLMMFRNVVYIRKKFKDYNLNKKIQYIWLFVLTMALGLRNYIPL